MHYSVVQHFEYFSNILMLLFHIHTRAIIPYPLTAFGLGQAIFANHPHTSIIWCKDFLPARTWKFFS